MHLKKHVGCLLALGLATTSAFAAEWFTATVQADLSAAGWTGATDSWTWSGTYGKLNSPDAELKFVAATAKTLPGDESTIKTSVKFTAMDKEDFFVKGSLPTIPDGAKGGLTIIDDGASSKFYGIVGGAWVELEGNTAAALAGQVNVEVKIWENNGKHISYKVGGQPLTLNGKSDLTASFIESTISSVSYKGVCEIASLQGDAQDELWTLTLKTIADVQSVLYRVGSGEWTTVPQDKKIKATTEKVQVKYVAAYGKYFFPASTGAGVTELKGTETSISGDADLSKDEALANVSTASEAVAEVVDGEKYASIGAAVGAGSAVNVLKDVDESVTVGKALTLTAEENVDISGTFTWGTGGTLTIESGAYDCGFAGFTPDTLILQGGCYTQSATEVQPFCATKYFASDLDGTYKSAVAVGADVEKSGDMPAITVAQSVASEAAKAGKTTSAYLQEETAGLGSIKRWQSYALGLGTAPVVAPELGVANDKDVKNINVAKNFEPLASTGVDVTYQVDGVPTAEPKIAVSELDYGATKKVVKVLTGDQVAVTTTIGANKVAAPAKGTRSLVTVPWADSATGTGVKVADLFKTANLVGGETLELYDQDADAYVSWTFTNGAWQNTTASVANYDNAAAMKARDADSTFVKKGQALWFTGSADAVQFGVDSTVASDTPVAAGKWGFVANPISAASKTLSAIIEASAAPSAQVQLTDKSSGATVIYFVKDGSWGYNTVEKRKRVFKAVDPSIAPGQEFWFDNKGASSANLAW